MRGNTAYTLSIFLMKDKKNKYKLFYFLLPIYDRENIVYGSKLRSRDFNGFTRFEVPWSQKSNLADVLCMRVLSTYVRNKSKNFKSGILICIICKYYLKFFMKIGQRFWIQMCTKEFEFITASGKNFFLVHFCTFRLH